MTRKAGVVLFYALPIVLMISLIPLIQNDYVLAGVYGACIVALLFIKREKNDLIALAFGIIGITIAESFFISTGVETFARQSFLGMMPLWLPFLWGYAFVTIKRTLRVLDH
ncbi:DUF2878 family protein [Candidatus Parcubacteria bacterium]|nr:MAG: DUF2878 family protein [Candidatus Parcubacteria bacterium]